MDTPIQDYSDEGHYFAILYRRSAVFFLELKALAGEEGFYQALREIIGLSQSGRLVTGGQVLTAFGRQVEAAKLDELVSRYFRRDPRSANPGGPASPTPGVRATATATTAASPTGAATKSAVSATNTPTPAPTETRFPSPTATVALSPTLALIVLATATWTAPASTPTTVRPATARGTSTPEPPAQVSLASQADAQSFEPLVVGLAAVAGLLVGAGLIVLIGRRRR